jgi:hypothetical protein
MTDLEMLFKAVDELTPEELNQLHDYVEQKRRTTWWVVPPENLAEIAEIMRPVQEDAANMTEEEINEVIDEAIAEVRRERKQNQSRR